MWVSPSCMLVLLRILCSCSAEVLTSTIGTPFLRAVPLTLMPCPQHPVQTEPANLPLTSTVKPKKHTTQGRLNLFCTKIGNICFSFFPFTPFFLSVISPYLCLMAVLYILCVSFFLISNMAPNGLLHLVVSVVASHPLFLLSASPHFSTWSWLYVCAQWSIGVRLCSSCYCLKSWSEEECWGCLLYFAWDAAWSSLHPHTGRFTQALEVVSKSTDKLYFDVKIFHISSTHLFTSNSKDIIGLKISE